MVVRYSHRCDRVSDVVCLLSGIEVVGNNHQLIFSASMKQKFYIALLFGLTLLSAVVKACPNCKDAYGTGTKEAGIGEMYSWSVLFMLGMFSLVLFGGMGFIAWRIKKSAKF